MTITFTWAQFAMALYLALTVAASVAMHGKPRAPYNAWYTIASAAIFAAMLWWGGFWR